MLATERKKLILDYLDQNHTASTQTLCDLTGASLATTRRDLAQLEEKGLLTRTHGGAQKPERSAAPEKDESNYFQVFSSIKMADGAVTRVSSVDSSDVILSAHFIFPAYVRVQLPGAATKLASRRKSEAFFIGFGNIHNLL